MQEQKTLILASLYDYKWLEYLFRAEQYSVVQFGSGAEVLRAVMTRQPDMLALFGFALNDMTTIDLAKKINETLPDRKMGLIYMYQGDFVDDSDIKWNVEGIDAYFPCYFPNEILHGIIKKVESIKNSTSA